MLDRRTMSRAAWPAVAALATGAAGREPDNGDALPGEPPAGLFAGPEVEQATEERPSLVERSLSGEMEMLETLPELAAIDLLDLTPEQRRLVDDALAARGAVLDPIAIERYQKLEELRQGRRANDGGGEPRRQMPRRVERAHEFVVALRPLLERGPLMEEVSSALPDGTRDVYETMVREYREAAMEQRTAETTPWREGREVRGAGRREASPEMRARTASRLADRFGDDAELIVRVMSDPVMAASYRQEVGYAYRRVLESASARRDDFFERIDATPEEMATLRDALRRSREVDDPSERREIMMEALRKLEPEKRRRVIEQLRARRAP